MERRTLSHQEAVRMSRMEEDDGNGERGIKITPGLRAYTNVRKSAFYLRVLL